MNIFQKYWNRKKETVEEYPIVDRKLWREVDAVQMLQEFVDTKEGFDVFTIGYVVNTCIRSILQLKRENIELQNRISELEKRVFEL